MARRAKHTGKEQNWHFWKNGTLAFALAAFPLFVFPAPREPGGGLQHAEALYKEQRWPDAEKAFLAAAGENAGQASVSAPALVKAGLCRLRMRDEKGAMDLFKRVMDDPAAAKNAPADMAAAFDQAHILLLKQDKRPAREKVILDCRKALPGHAATARMCEREGDARLEAGAIPKALEYYALAGGGLSPAGTNIVRLLAVRKTGIAPTPLSEADAFALAAVAAARPACGLALCDILSKRGEGWRVEDTRARILAEQKKFAEACAVWENLLKSGQGPADAIALVVAETRGFKAGESAAALPAYEAWLKRHTGSPLREKAEYQRAGLLWTTGDFAGAVSRFESFLEAYPSGIYAQAAQDTLARARIDLANLRRNAENAANAAGADDPLAASISLAERKLRDGNAGEALKILNGFRGKESHPQWGRAWHGRGACYRELGEPDKALAAWDEVLRQAALFTNTLCAAECRRAKADVWFEDFGEPDKALPEYQTLLTLSGGQPDPALEQRAAQALLALGRGAEARPVFEAFRQKESGDPLRVRYWDGLIALCAVPAAPATVTRDERTAETLKRVADVHFAAERWEKALPLYLKAAKTLPSSETAAWATLQRARCLANLDRREKALDTYDLFKKDYRKSGWADDALLRAGVLCAGPMNDPEKGMGYFREILASHAGGDQAETAFLYLATLAWWTGKWKDAETLHREFLEKYPESPFRDEFLAVRFPAIAARRKTVEEK